MNDDNEYESVITRMSDVEARERRWSDMTEKAYRRGCHQALYEGYLILEKLGPVPDEYAALLNAVHDMRWEQEPHRLFLHKAMQRAELKP